jgi:hypothetical protein
MHSLATEPATTADWLSAWGQVLSAFFTLVAVIVALSIAVKDSRRTTREARARTLAQARLVYVRGLGVGNNPTQDGEFWDNHLQCRIANYSEKPIFDVHLEIWAQGQSLDERPKWGVQDELVLPGYDDIWKPGIRTREQDPRIAGWRVRWSDVEGRHWQVRGSGDFRPEPFDG